MENAALSLNKPKVRVRGIALPVEHGSWGFLFEPLAAALFIAPSFGGLCAALIYIGAFLMRQPLKIFLGDLQAKRNLPQTIVSRNFVLIYAAIALTGLTGCFFTTKPENFVPALIVLPIAIFQIYLDANRKSRELFAEIAGAIAISSSAAVIALIGGWAYPQSLALWAIFVLRLIPSVLYIRNRLRLEKGKTFSFLLPLVANLIALTCVFMLAFQNLIPKLTVAAFLILTVRAALGLSKFRRPTKAMKIGVLEVVYGVVTALSVVAGFYLDI